MERVRPVFLALAVTLILFQNLHSKDRPVRDVEGVTSGFSRFEENGKVGLKDEHGRVLIPALYEAIGWSNGRLAIIDRVVGYQADGQWGLINTSNKTVTAPEFLALNPGEGSFLIGKKKSPLSQRASFGVISTGGKTIIPFIYDELHLSHMRAVVMSRIDTRYLFGLTDLTHKILIPIKFQRIYSLGSLRFAVENAENKTAIFSDEGIQMTPFDIDSISSFKNGFAIVYQDQKQGLIGRNGQFIARPIYGEIRTTEEGNILARQLHRLYLLRGDNTLIREFSADGIVPLSDRHYLVYASGKVQLTSNDFVPLHPEYLSTVGKFQNGLAVYQRNGRFGVISSEGNIVIPARYHALEIESNKAFRARLNTGAKHRWVILNASGEPVTEKPYEYIGAFNGKFYPAKSRGFWGALNAAGEEIMTCVHDSLLQELNDNVVVRFKGEYGVMNLHEDWVVTPQSNPLKLLDEQAYLAFDDSITYLKSFRGDLIYFSENPLAYQEGYIREQLPSGAHWIVDMSGVVIQRSNQPAEADQIFAESEGLRVIRKDGKFGFIDDAGRLRVANRYEMARAFQGGLAAIRIQGRWGFIDRQESLVVQPAYDHVENFHNGMAIVRRDGYSGLIDNKGKVILPLRYDAITPNEHNRYILRTGESYGMADAAGAIIIHPKYDEIVDPGNGYVIARRNGKSGVMTLHAVSTIPMIYDDLSYDHYHDQFVGVRESEFEALR